MLCTVSWAQIYPWGPEVQWTRASWPELKLPFPYGLLRKPAFDQSFLFHSANGPYNHMHYDNLERQQAKRCSTRTSFLYDCKNHRRKPFADLAPFPRARRRPLAAPVDQKALLRCNICNMLVMNTWESAVKLFHGTGEVPTLNRLDALLLSACETKVAHPFICLEFSFGLCRLQLPNILVVILRHQDGGAESQVPKIAKYTVQVSDQLAQIPALPASALAANLLNDISERKITEVCYAVKKVSQPLPCLTEGSRPIIFTKQSSVYMLWVHFTAAVILSQMRSLNGNINLGCRGLSLLRRCVFTQFRRDYGDMLQS